MIQTLVFPFFFFCLARPRSMQDPNPAVETWSPNHWTTGGRLTGGILTGGRIF